MCRVEVLACQVWHVCQGLPTPALDDSISLKFTLDSRLKSESFDTLDDLLGFQVQKL